jgi:hypothetical protein
MNPAIKYEAYTEDESAEDEFVDPKNPMITIESESTDITEDESIEPKNPVVTIEDESAKENKSSNNPR